MKHLRSMEPSIEARYGHMVHEYYVERLRALAKKRRTRLAAIRTRAEAERYREEVRKSVRRCFGPFPMRTPLNASVTGEYVAGSYVIRHVIFESRPQFPVTANLYIPRGRGPFPAVLFPCGHSIAGKAGPTYQLAASGLASMGYLVLVYDPVSQGERFQYTHLRGPWPGGRQRENSEGHNMAAKQMWPLGDFFGDVRAWDGIRALDLLLSQPEADPTRVGITGNSGGGTMTTWLNALEDRFTMAAPGCFITAWRYNLENEQPADAEQCPPGPLAAGLDLADFLIARAPRPTLLLGQRHDFFDLRGLEEAYDDIRRIYRLLGAERHIELFVGEEIHGLWSDNRQAVYRFFNRHAGVRATPCESARPREASALEAAPRGQVRFIPGQRFLWELTAERARSLASERTRHPLSEDALRRCVTRTLQLPTRRVILYERHLRWQRKAPAGTAWALRWFHTIETEPGIQTMIQIWELPRKEQYYQAALPAYPTAEVYIPHVSAEEDLMRGVAPVQGDAPLFCIEPRGIGMMRATTCGSERFFTANGQDYLFTAMGLMLNESYFGRRVHDVLCALDAISARGTRNIHLIGCGLGAMLAAFAGLLHPQVWRVTLKNYLPSLHALSQTPIIAWPVSMLPWGALRLFDLPDIYRVLRRRKRLRLMEPWDGMMRPRPPSRNPAYR